MYQSKYSALPFAYKLARFSLLLRNAYPFLGELCMRVEKYRRELIGLAATDGLRLYLNETQLNDLPEESLNFVLLHELFHIILRHRYPKDMPFYEKKYWNIGYDLTVNWLIMSMEQELLHHGLKVLPIAETVLTTDDLSKDPPNLIARAFVQQAVSQGILSQAPPLFVEIEWKSFNSIVFNDSKFIFDLLDANEVSNAPTDAAIRELFANCEKSAGMYGLPWRLTNLWNEINDKEPLPLPWHIILRHFLEGMSESEDFDFCPPDKRVLYSGMVLPAETIEEGDELNNALIVLDVSSSISKPELMAQVWQVNSVLNELMFTGSIISFASTVYQEAQLSNKASLKRFVDELDVGGGTDWKDVVHYVEKNKRHARPIIVFTDGYFYSYEEGLKNVIFITQEDYPEDLKKLGRVIKIKKRNTERTE